MNPILSALEKSMKSFRVSRKTRLLVGVSGGIDSMVMVHGLHQLNFDVTAAHVNFKLRGAESDVDARLVRDWCREHQVPFLLKETDTKKFAEQENLNIQLAARKIRYDWWDTLRREQNFDFVVTAHTLDDQIETFFINLLRGTGLKGLQGIPVKRDDIIRPLLAVSREAIETFAHDHEVPYRTDRSNLGDDYQRNRIRHHLIPLLTDMTTGFHARMKHNLFRLEKEWTSWETAFREWTDRSIRPVQDSFSIEFRTGDEAFLLRWLEEKGIPWNLSADFIASPSHNSGNRLHGEDYQLSRTHHGYFFEKIKKAEQLIIPQSGTYLLDDMSFSIHPVEPQKRKWDHDPWEEFLSGSVVTFPLYLRAVEPGDNFQPLGMPGRHKKIQDLLVDRKLEMHEKSKVRLLTNAHHILWVAGIQLDDRAKVSDDDEQVYRVTFKTSNR